MNDARERIEDGKDQVINGELEELSCSIEKVEINSLILLNRYCNHFSKSDQIFFGNN